MTVYRRGSVYWAKFMSNGVRRYKSTETGNLKKARQIEARLKSEVALGNVGILKQRPDSTLKDFLADDFLPYIEAHFASKPNTVAYYRGGARLLQKDLGDLMLAEINSKHAAGFAARHRALAVATINRSLRTLRRALNLAQEWGKVSHAPRIPLAKGEHQRERIVTDRDFERYLSACPQPWRDIVLLIRGAGMRPGECYALRWEHVLLNGIGGLIQIATGKTKAARRALPMVPEVYAALKARAEEQGHPETGWIFPRTQTASGHVEAAAAIYWHRKALRSSGVERFEPYCLRHTALTRLAESGCDAFTLARIAGHTSVVTTQRYTHPQQEAIERAFEKVTASGDKIGDSRKILARKAL